MNKPNYTILTPFKRWTIQNFPFIEEDFDAITNYQLLCKIVEYLNKVIENEKLLEQSNNELIDAFNNLKSYVDNYFENLNVQDEIDNKLDEMAESGQLTDIIAQYLGLAGILTFDTISDLSDALNITEGSTCYTLGQYEYNDGKGGFYKIRTITSEDVVDGLHIIALDVSNTLIGERIPNYYIDTINSQIIAINNKINNLDVKPTICIGDSYGKGYTVIDDEITYVDSWCDTLKDLFNLDNTNFFKFVENSAGFVKQGDQGHNFIELLQTNESVITDKTQIKQIIVGGGLNDYTYTSNDIRTRLSAFITYCNTNYPNATVYLAPFGNAIGTNETRQNTRIGFKNTVIPTYSFYGVLYGYKLLKSPNYCTKLKNYICSDNTHMTETGYNHLGHSIYNAISGNDSFILSKLSGTLNNIMNYDTTGFTFETYSQVINDKNIINIGDIRLIFSTPVAFNPYNSFVLCAVNLPTFDGINDGDTITPIQMTVKNHADNSLITLNGTIQINKNNQLIIKSLDVLGGAYVNINIDALVINAFKIECSVN